MKALGVTTFGPPSTIQILNLPTPTIQSPNDILISIKCIALNRSDAIRARGWTRIFEHIKLPHVIGADFSGVVHEVGDNVTKFKPGDPVYGFSIFVRGCGSQFLHLTEETRHYVAKIPYLPSPLGAVGLERARLSFEEAAGLTVVCATAFSALWQAEEILGGEGALKGKSVLVIGGLGGVGSSAVMVLKSVFGVGKVVVTVSTPKVSLVDELLKGKVGQVVDYTKEDVVKGIGKGTVDFALDTVGTGMQYIEMVKKDGLMLCILGKTGKTARIEIPGVPRWICWGLDLHSWAQSTRAGRYGVRYLHTFAKRDERLEKAIENWVGKGKLRMIVGKVIEGNNIEDVRAAVEMVGTAKSTVGKVIVEINGLDD